MRVLQSKPNSKDTGALECSRAGADLAEMTEWPSVWSLASGGYMTILGSGHPLASYSSNTKFAGECSQVPQGSPDTVQASGAKVTCWEQPKSQLGMFRATHLPLLVLIIAFVSINFT